MKASNKDGGRERAGAGKADPKGGSAKGGNPEWAQSLRQLYDSVVDEPLPDNFRNLLDQLDKRA